jgi:hypothetical protein
MRKAAAMAADTDEELGPLLDPGGGPEGEGLIGIFDDDPEPEAST